MRRFLTITAICLVGFAVGFAGHAYLRPVQSRTDRIFQIFVEVCLPAAQSGEIVIPAALELHEWRHGWIDIRSASFVSVSPDHCSVQTNEPNGLSREQGKALGYRVSELVTEKFPDLARDEKANLGPETISMAWMAGQARSAERWGIYHFVFPYSDQAGDSTTSFTFPPR